MARAPFNVLVFPYRITEEGKLEYAIFRRADGGLWQGIAGGGEDDDTPLEAAKRETSEESGIPSDCDFLQLDTTAPVPVTAFSHIWEDDIYVIPQYSFGVAVGSHDIVLSHEHTEYRWLKYEQAYSRLKFDGDKTALWELDRKLHGLGPRY